MTILVYTLFMTQEESLAIMDDGNSVLLTGAAGTGKTYTLNQYVRMSRSKGKTIALTATTGLAATHINGTTIHSWSGLGINDTIPPNFVDNLTNQRVDIIRSSDILIIDEISMMHHWRLDMIDKACQLVRGSELPFGGLQVILAGDFFQLPPINRADSKYGGFITESEIWQNDHFVTCYLTEQYRQKEDQTYTEILNGIRAGFLSSRQIHLLKSKIGTPLPEHEASTRLLTTNADVDQINEVRLSELSGEEFTYEMVTTGPKKYVEQLKNACLATEYLKLKVGAFVMCIKNSADKKFVNGSLGVVTGFESSTHYPIVKLNNGRQVTLKPDTWELLDGPKKRASLSQIPLRLAWAITIHKSQGMTLDNAKIDLSKAFVEGMGYVALSRVKNINNLSLDGLNNMAFQVSPEAKKINSELVEASQQAVNIYAKQIKSFKQRAKDVVPIAVTKESKMTWSEKLAKMRLEYPNAYLPWTATDDKKLVASFSSGEPLEKLSKKFGRHIGSIRTRLEKHLGEDIFDE